MVKWITILGVLVCLSGSSFSSSKMNPDDNEYAFPSWESDEDYYDIGCDLNDGHSLNYDNNKHEFNHAVHDNHGYNYYWESHTHNGSPGTSRMPVGRYGGSHGHPGGNYAHHGQNWGSYGHHSQTGSSRQASADNGPNRGLSQNSITPPQRPNSDADRVVFPDFTSNNRIPLTRPPTQIRTTTTRPTNPTIRTTTDRSLLNVVVCLRSCPTTSEYNPVCGTNNVTYNNPGALQCAKNCGINVSVERQAPCPRVVPIPQPTRLVSNPTIWASVAGQTSRATSASRQPNRVTAVRRTTAATEFPAVNPTRYTNINLNVSPTNSPDTTLIPLDVLQSVFGNASPTNNDDNSAFAIDRRTITPLN